MCNEMVQKANSKCQRVFEMSPAIRFKRERVVPGSCPARIPVYTYSNVILSDGVARSKPNIRIGNNTQNRSFQDSYNSRNVTRVDAYRVQFKLQQLNPRFD